ncbi:transcriptional regulator, AraC family [Actinacidiphila alni]|uniref:Transcriptional regulator, AraC family n=1 Tax=Actinacidiphila alni TaxID=380248 RepID=A0A1I2HEF0_9ACTN|nr:helix-turn-helix domain-containing protein [Actinacidiphila alni]SFF27106.1 transcriptional regulator, AraC family [Actinacidiphila alni]
MSTGIVVDEAVRGRPASALRGLVAWYSGYRQRGVPVTRHRGLPSPYLTLILTLDEPITVAAHPDPADPPGDYAALVGGLHTTPALITVPGRQSGVQIALDPLGARTLLGLPAGALAGADLAAEDVLGPTVAEAHDLLRAAPDWPGRFAVLDAWLLGRARSDVRLAPEVRHAWHLLAATGGSIGVAALAAGTGWSERRLRDRFAAEVGLSPKAAARVIRFDRTRRGLAARPGTEGGLARLAADRGYFDQAHMDREFRAMAGCPPTAWLAEERRNIQSGHHPPG